MAITENSIARGGRCIAVLAFAILCLSCFQSARASTLFESYSYGANNYLVAVDPATGYVKSNLVPIAAPLMGLAYGDGELFESYIYGGVDRLVAVDATTGYAKSDLVAIAAPLTGLAYGDGELFESYN